MNESIESAFVDAMEDVFVAFDGDGAAVTWNAAATTATGYGDGLEGTTLPELVAAGDEERVRDAVAQVRDAGTATVEADLETAAGERTPYEFKLHRLPAGSEAAFACLGHDVSDRHHKADQLVARERTLRRMYEVISDRNRTFEERIEALLALGRVELDVDYGTLSRIEGEEYVFEVVDAADDSIQAGDVVPLSATNCEIAASDERTLVLGDIERDAPEETDRAGYAEWGISCYIGAPVFVEEGVYGTFCFYDTEPRKGQFSDWEVTLVDLMSRWVSYELQRERSRDELEEQNERLERFASVVSHDLRNPMSVVAGAIELAEETGELDELERAHRALDRMRQLIDDLLALSRSGEVIDELEAVALDELVTECWENVPTADATLVLDTERTIRADRTRLRQLLENLVRNAIEHGTTGGDGVTITVGDVEDGFYVADDGPGIPADEREEVFESGYSTHPDGTGFGLAIVAEVADAHGWAIAVTESEGGGARFEVTGVGE